MGNESATLFQSRAREGAVTAGATFDGTLPFDGGNRVAVFGPPARYNNLPNPSEVSR
jgi:hypothetical protein